MFVCVCVWRCEEGGDARAYARAHSAQYSRPAYSLRMCTTTKKNLEQRDVLARLEYYNYNADMYIYIHAILLIVACAALSRHLSLPSHFHHLCCLRPAAWCPYSSGALATARRAYQTSPRHSPTYPCADLVRASTCISSEHGTSKVAHL